MFNEIYELEPLSGTGLEGYRARLPWLAFYPNKIRSIKVRPATLSDMYVRPAGFHELGHHAVLGVLLVGKSDVWLNSDLEMVRPPVFWKPWSHMTRCKMSPRNTGSMLEELNHHPVRYVVMVLTGSTAKRLGGDKLLVLKPPLPSSQWTSWTDWLQASQKAAREELDRSLDQADTSK